MECDRVVVIGEVGADQVVGTVHVLILALFVLSVLGRVVGVSANYFVAETSIQSSHTRFGI
jgi:hypothetical protein